MVMNDNSGIADLYGAYVTATRDHVFWRSFIIASLTPSDTTAA